MSWRDVATVRPSYGQIWRRARQLAGRWGIDTVSSIKYRVGRRRFCRLYHPTRLHRVPQVSVMAKGLSQWLCIIRIQCKHTYIWLLVCRRLNNSRAASTLSMPIRLTKTIANNSDSLFLSLSFIFHGRYRDQSRGWRVQTAMAGDDAIQCGFKVSVN